MIERATIAHSRPKNQRDKLISSKLYETESCNAATIIQKMRAPNGQASWLYGYKKLHHNILYYIIVWAILVFSILSNVNFAILLQDIL